MSEILTRKQKTEIINEMISFMDKHGEFNIEENPQKGSFRIFSKLHTDVSDGIFLDKDDAEMIHHILKHLTYLLNEAKKYNQENI